MARPCEGLMRACMRCAGGGGAAVVRLCGAVALLLLLCCCTVGTDAWSIDLTSGWDTSYDWSKYVYAKGVNGCSYTPPPKPLSFPSCPPVAADYNLTELALKWGWRYAPIVKQHPLDWSWLTDPEHWARNATAYDPRTYDPIKMWSGGDGRNTTVYSDVFAARSYASKLINSSGTGFEDWDSMRRDFWGDPVVNNRLTGNVWFDVFDNDFVNILPEMNAAVFVYHMFYPWNGCSNQMLSTAIDGRYQGVEYYMCPIGIHDGDWEHVKVFVCKADLLSPDPDIRTTLKQMQLSQHSWIPVVDCQKGECEFGVDDAGLTRPVVYSALHSHAHFPYETPVWIYFRVNITLLANLDGIFIVDRVSSKGPWWMPNQNNTKFLQTYVNRTLLNENPFAYMEDPQKGWVTYKGSWGAPMSGTGRTITCLFDNATVEAPCNMSNPSTNMLWKFTRPRDSPADINWTLPVDFSVIPRVNPGGPAGAFYRPYNYYWAQDPGSDWYNGMSAEAAQRMYETATCPMSGDPNETYLDFVPLNTLTLTEVIAVMVSLGVGLGLLLSITLCIPLARDKDVGKEVTDEPLLEGHEEAPLVLAPANNISRYILWWLLGLACYVTGLVLTVVGATDVLSALSRLISSSAWDAIWDTIVVLMSVFGFVELLVIVTALVFQSGTLVCYKWRCSNFLFRRSAPHCMRSAGWRTSAVLAGLLLILINCTVLFFAVGFLLWVAHFGMNKICTFAIQTLFNNLDISQSVCLDLEPLGISRTVCGADLPAVCNEWQDLKVNLLIYGALIFVMAHIMFLMIATSAYTRMRLTARMELARQKLYTDGYNAAVKEGAGGDANGNGNGAYTAPKNGAITDGDTPGDKV